MDIKKPIAEQITGVPEAVEKIKLGIGRKAHHSPKQLKTEIDRYFEYNKNNLNRITPAGMILSLGVTRATWGIYMQKPTLSAVCEEAMMKLEHLGTLRLYSRGNNADIFYLKNMGWVDKKETETKVIELIGENMSNEQETKIIERAVKRLSKGGRRRAYAKGS